MHRKSSYLTRLVPLAFSLCAPLLAIAAPAQRAYVANEHDGTVSEIDTQEDEVRRLFTVHGKGGDKLQAAIADRAGKSLFVVDSQSSSVAVVDLATAQVV